MPPRLRKRHGFWKAIPVHCSYCCKVNVATTSSNERVGWCSHRHRVFRVSLLKAPDWVTGVLLILVVNFLMQ